MSRYIEEKDVYKLVEPNGVARVHCSQIDDLPRADVVEVVRCKDCKHSYFVKSCSKYECQKGCGTLKYSNDYCSYGERRAENGKS